MNGLLQGLKVLDLSSVLAGPLTGSFLAECGADVLKVEAPGGDVTRTWRAQGEATDQTSAYFSSANTGKRVATCDLKSEQGRAWLRDQLADTDILLQNMKWRDLERMGLLPHELGHPSLHWSTFGLWDTTWTPRGWLMMWSFKQTPDSCP